VDPRWEGSVAFSEFQKRWSRPSAEALLRAVEAMDPEDENCGCSTHRWESILL
jgi:hypothetical protein